MWRCNKCGETEKIDVLGFIGIKTSAKHFRFKRLSKAGFRSKDTEIFQLDSQKFHMICNKCGNSTILDGIEFDEIKRKERYKENRKKVLNEQKSAKESEILVRE